MVGEVTERMAVTRSPWLPSDLKLRVASGIVLAAAALAADFAGPLSFSALVITVAGLMCWEWGRLVRSTALDAAHVVHALTVAAAALLAANGAYLFALSALLAGCIAMPAARPATAPRLSVLGVPYVGLPAVALIWFRNDEPYGALAVLFIFAIVWTTDTFAYVCGTLIGGPKLWPRLSPNKTWAGTIGGVVFAAVAGLVLAVCIGRPSPVELAATGLVLSVCAQVGDLAESALKRAFDVKHASRLIPGHGGFLDRMDGVVVAAGVAAAAAMLVNVAEPARALLLWN
jgi:phosphatidate cytidylyltransferase